MCRARGCTPISSARAACARTSRRLLDKIGEFLDNRLQLFEDAIWLVADNRIFKQRNVDIGKVHKDDAIAWGFRVR